MKHSADTCKKRKILKDNIKKILLIGVIGMVTGLSQAMASVDFSPYISVAEVYDDNVFLVNDGMDKEDDFITTVTPRLVGEYKGKRTDLSIDYMTRLEFSARFEEKNAVNNHSGGLRYNFRASKEITFNIRDNLQFIAAENQLLRNEAAIFRQGTGGYGAGMGGSIGGVLTLNPSDILTNSVSPSVSYSPSPSISLTAAYRNVITEYDVSSFTDTVEHQVNFGSDYRLSSFNTLKFGGRYRNFTFDTGEHNEIYSLEGGVNHIFSSTLSTEIVGGVYFTEDRTGWSGGGSVNKRLKHGDMAAGYERRVSSTRGFGGVSITQSYYILLSQTHSRRLNSEVSARYIDANSISGEAIGTDTISSSIGLNYIIAKGMSGGIYYSYSYQDYNKRERGVINLHQFRLNMVYNWQRFLIIRPSYSYFYRYNIIGKWPVRDNRVLLEVGVSW